VPVLSQLGGVADAIGSSVIPGYDAIGKATDAFAAADPNGLAGKSGTSGQSGGYGGLTPAQLLSALGSTAQGVANYAQTEAQRKQQADEFAKTYGLQANQQGMQAASQLNRAPLADKAQFLAMNSAAPTPFQPRDYTQGLNQLQQPAQGGAAAQLAANAAASSNYKPGAGGVDTSTLQAILARLGYGPGTSPRAATG
jgi:hypothetical protein